MFSKVQLRLWKGTLKKSNLFSVTLRCLSSEKNVLVSRAKRLEIPTNVPLHEHIWKNLGKFSGHTAIVCAETERSYTFGEIHKKSLAVTRFLKHSLKLKHQDTICLVLKNLPEYPIILLGAIQAGVRVSTCNPNYTADELKRQILDSGSAVIFTSTGLLPTVKAAIAATKIDIPYVVVNEVSQGGISDGIDFNQISSGDTCDPFDVNVEEDVAILPYSSGTTGLPKGVELTHYNIVANLYQNSSPEFGIQTVNDGHTQDVLPAFLPFYHIYGMTVILLQSMFLGNKLVTIPNFNPAIFFKVIKQKKASLIYCVPLIANLVSITPNLNMEDLASIRAFLSGAAPLGAADIERFVKRTGGKIDLLQGYGMTETSPVTIVQSRRMENGDKIGGAGILLPNTEAKIVSLDGSSLEALGPEQSGELLVRGPQIMKGYHNNPEATSQMLLPDGWLRTGDVAYYDEHDNFFITDRIKELIKVKGFQVAPAELEEVLRSHPDVADAGVTAVPHPTQDEAPKAFVVLKKDASVAPEDLGRFVEERVAKHKRLVGGVQIVGAIPKNPSGKILRRELKKL